MAGSSRSNSWMCLLIKLIIRGQQQKKSYSFFYITSTKAYVCLAPCPLQSYSTWVLRRGYSMTLNHLLIWFCMPSVHFTRMVLFSFFIFFCWLTSALHANDPSFTFAITSSTFTCHYRFGVRCCCLLCTYHNIFLISYLFFLSIFQSIISNSITLPLLNEKYLTMPSYFFRQIWHGLHALQKF